MINKNQINVSSCQQCPFSNNDNEFGYNACNLAIRRGTPIELKNWEELPEKSIHKDCPLDDYIFVLKKPYDN
jgi:hypothetical protein